MYSTVNQIEVRQMNNTFIRGAKLIDTITMLNGIIQCVEGCKLINENVIVLSNYRAYVVNINFEQYFSKQLSL